MKAKKNRKQIVKCPWIVGKAYFVRTVTNYLTGRLIWVGNQELVFEDAAWIADTGRFSQAMASGQFNEIEPWLNGEVIVGRGSVIDAYEWSLSLPREIK